MKAGTKVSFATTATGPGRTFGVFVGQSEGGSLVAVDGAHEVRNVVLVSDDRVAEFKAGESFSEHAARVNGEMMAAARAKAQATYKKALEAAKKKQAQAGGVRWPVLALILLIGCLVGGVYAIDNLSTIRTTTYSYWSGGSTNGASTLSWVIVPAHSSIANATPVITAIDATTDKLAAKIQSYKVLETTVATFTNATVSIPVNTTNTGSKWDSGTIIVRHLLTDQYEKRSLATSGGATNLQVSAATLETVVPGDLIYKVSTTGAAALTVTTNGAAASLGLSYNRATGEALLVGQPGMPLLLEIDGTGANATLNSATAKYVPSAPQSPRLTP